MSEKLVSLLAACAVTFTVLAAAAPAVAKDRPIIVKAQQKDVPVRLVSYRDLNLARAEDERTLVRRVRLAAEDVCNESAHGDIAFAPVMRTCRANAWSGAKPQIDLAVTRAREIAANGFSAIAPVAISIAVR